MGRNSLAGILDRELCGTPPFPPRRCCRAASLEEGVLGLMPPGLADLRPAGSRSLKRDELVRGLMGRSSRSTFLGSDCIDPCLQPLLLVEQLREPGRLGVGHRLAEYAPPSAVSDAATA
jgi:hypothetical protein